MVKDMCHIRRLATFSHKLFWEMRLSITLKSLLESPLYNLSYSKHLVGKRNIVLCKGLEQGYAKSSPHTCVFWPSDYFDKYTQQRLNTI